MKKTFIIPVFLCFTTLFSGCKDNLEYSDKPVINSVDLVLSQTSCNLEVGEIFKIEYLTSNTELKPTFSSSDESVAIVDSEGNVTAKKIGLTIINIEFGEKHYLCEINVSASKQYYIFIENDDIVITVGSSFTLNPILKKSNDIIATDVNFKFVSKDTNVFTVSENVITGKAVGESELLITASFENVDYYNLVDIKVI